METGRKIFTGNKFTIDSPIDLQLEKLPDLAEPIDLEKEIKKVDFFPNKNGIQYYLSDSDLARIQYWEDETESKSRLAVVYMQHGNFPTYREATISELVRFFRVASATMPDHYLTKNLQVQIKARLMNHEDALRTRAGDIEELLRSL